MIRNLFTPSLRDQLVKILWITGAWMIIAVLQSWYDLGVIRAVHCDLGSWDEPTLVMSALMTGLIAGVLGGSVVVFLWSRWLRTTQYWWSILSILISFSVIYLIVATTSRLIYFNQAEGYTLNSWETWKYILGEQFETSQIRGYLFWLMVVLCTMIVLLVNDKYGPGVLRAFLLGKYFRPKREERIFMFVDLQSSTLIAEQLGEERYFNFIKDVFAHSTPAILATRGEIYQYVGDEIIVSWPVRSGSENANCLSCFYEISRALAIKRAYYEETYDVVPEFKAGLHYGYVMAGEIGIVKRDIAFSGDVLNTTARIRSTCNELGVNILFSKLLLDRLIRLPERFAPREIGSLVLRGKSTSMTLFTL